MTPFPHGLLQARDLPMIGLCIFSTELTAFHIVRVSAVTRFFISDTMQIPRSLR
jgi:hypothetical protein